jgi:hypothetical protein
VSQALLKTIYTHCLWDKGVRHVAGIPPEVTLLRGCIVLAHLTGPTIIHIHFRLSRRTNNGTAHALITNPSTVTAPGPVYSTLTATSTSLQPGQLCQPTDVAKLSLRILPSRHLHTCTPHCLHSILCALLRSSTRQKPAPQLRQTLWNTGSATSPAHHFLLNLPMP